MPMLCNILKNAKKRRLGWQSVVLFCFIQPTRELVFLANMRIHSLYIISFLPLTISHVTEKSWVLFRWWRILYLCCGTEKKASGVFENSVRSLMINAIVWITWFQNVEIWTPKFSGFENYNKQGSFRWNVTSFLLPVVSRNPGRRGDLEFGNPGRRGGTWAWKSGQEGGTLSLEIRAGKGL